VKLLVLWEDQAAIPNNFGPHELLLRLVADARGREERLDQVKRHVQAIACRGNSNVPPKSRAITGPRLVVLDNDKVRRLLRLPADEPEDRVLAQLATACAVDPSSVALLHDSIEDVLAHVTTALGITKPVVKPTPSQRDEYFRKLVGADRARRDAFLVSCRDYERLRKAVVDFLQPIDIL
jgi:hypothetical protein